MRRATPNRRRSRVSEPWRAFTGARAELNRVAAALGQEFGCFVADKKLARRLATSNDVARGWSKLGKSAAW